MRGGDRVTGFEEIYREYFSDVYRYLLRLSGNPDIAEEITSETFFRALSSIDKFRGECEIRLWLCKIAKNCYYSYIKKQSRIADIGEESIRNIPDVSVSPEEKIQDADDAMRIRRVLREIPEPYKEVFMWRVFGELGFREIGQICGKNENWACVTYHRARKMIKERLEGGKNEK